MTEFTWKSEPGKTLSKLSQAKVIIPFPWNKGEPYEVGITTSDGIRFSKKVEVAARAPKSEYTTGVYVCNNRYVCGNDTSSNEVLCGFLL